MATSKRGGTRVPARTSQAPRRAPAPKPEVVEEAALVIFATPTIAQVQAAIASRTRLFFDGDAGSESILAGVLGKATDGFDLFAESTLEKVEDHLGELLTVTSIDAVRNSDYEGGLGVYLICTFVSADGEEIRMAIGQTDPLAKIVALAELGQLPWAVEFARSERATKGGFYPINLLSRQLKGGGSF